MSSVLQNLLPHLRTHIYALVCPVIMHPSIGSVLSVSVLAIGALALGLQVRAGAAGAGQGHGHAHEDLHLTPPQPSQYLSTNRRQEYFSVCCCAWCMIACLQQLTIHHHKTPVIPFDNFKLFSILIPPGT